MRAYRVLDDNAEEHIVVSPTEISGGGRELEPTEIDDKIVQDIMAFYGDQEIHGDGTGETLPEVPESAYGPDSTPLDG